MRMRSKSLSKVDINRMSPGLSPGFRTEDEFHISPQFDIEHAQRIINKYGGRIGNIPQKEGRSKSTNPFGSKAKANELNIIE